MRRRARMGTEPMCTAPRPSGRAAGTPRRHASGRHTREAQTSRPTASQPCSWRTTGRARRPGARPPARPPRLRPGRRVRCASPRANVRGSRTRSARPRCRRGRPSGGRGCRARAPAGRRTPSRAGAGRPGRRRARRAPRRPRGAARPAARGPSPCRPPGGRRRWAAGTRRTVRVPVASSQPSRRVLTREGPRTAGRRRASARCPSEASAGPRPRRTPRRGASRRRGAAPGRVP